MLRHHFEKSYHSLNTVFVSERSLRYNLNLFRKLLPNQSICPVLKSNAYGHDLILTAKALEKEKPDFFIVDSLYEAYRLRENGIKRKIFIMGYTIPQNLKGKQLGFHFACFDLKTAKNLAKLNVPVHIKIDTGLNRMGFSLNDLEVNLKKLRKMNINIEGVFTHLADADNRSMIYTNQQVKNFKKALKKVRDAGFNPKWIHIAASAGALKVEMPEANLVRLGVSLYGIEPYQSKDPFYQKLKTLKPAMKLVSTLTAIRQIHKGQKIGYACAYTAKKTMDIGVVATGYFEGIPRNLGEKGWVEIRGKLCPILGRICMNYIIVDISHVQAKLLDPVTIFSNDRKKMNSIEKVAELSNTIPNEILVQICESLVRVLV